VKYIACTLIFHIYSVLTLLDKYSTLDCFVPRDLLEPREWLEAVEWLSQKLVEPVDCPMIVAVAVAVAVAVVAVASGHLQM
jgi:hypothetical protein